MSATRAAARTARRPAAMPAQRSRATTARGPAATPLGGWRRWAWVGALVAAVTIGLPVAHALFGEVVALLGGTLLLGILLGRWTAPRR